MCILVFTIRGGKNILNQPVFPNLVSFNKKGQNFPETVLSYQKLTHPSVPIL